MEILSLSVIPEFRDAPRMLEFVRKIGFKKTFLEGEPLIMEGMQARNIPIVLKGRVRVMRTDEDGRELLLYYIKEGESCVMSFLNGLHLDPCKLRAIAEEDSEILFIPTHQLGHLIKEFPEWTSYIFRLYHARFDELLEVVNAVAFKRIDERLWNLLQQKSQLSANRILSITHEQLANELGTARVVVSRLLKQLEEHQKLKLGRNKIILLDEVL